MKIISKITLAIVATLAFTVSALNAAVINFPINNFNGNSTALNGFTVSSAIVNTDDVLYSFTNTGNLDGGTVNDTFTFDILVEGFSGSTSNGTDVTLGTTSVAVNQVAVPNINFGLGGSADFDPGESLVFTVLNPVFTNGEGNAASVAFDGFTTFFTTGSAASTQDWAIGTTGAEFFSLNRFANPVFANPQSPLVVTHLSGNNTAGIRILDSSFTVTIVPEASTFLILLGSLVLLALFRHKRSLKASYS